MASLTLSDLLERWEQGLSQTLPQRAFTLLGVARPDLSGDELSLMTIGQSERELLRLRERLFGSLLKFVAACPSCHTRVESTLHAADLESKESACATEVMALDFEGYCVGFRVPTVGDALHLDAAGGDDRACRLLEQCLVHASDPSGTSLHADGLPDGMVDAIAERMALADPQADVQLGLSCPVCGHAWQAVFDTAGFLWKEIHAWAQHTLRDVDQLARAYGWHESEVLALTSTRRRIYLELSRQ